MSPLPGTRMIPEGWGASLRPSVVTSMNLECQVLRPSSEPPPFGSDEAPPTTVWAGKCRLQQHVAGAGQVATADNVIGVHLYLAALPHETLALVVTGEAGDILEAAGHRYQILEAYQGSELAEADLIVQLIT